MRRMTVYVELVLLENFAADYIILLLAGKLTGLPLRRPAAAALIGAVCACLVPLWEGFSLFPCRLAAVFLMVLPAFRIRRLRELGLSAGACALLFGALYGLVRLAGRSVDGLFYREDGVFLLALLSLLGSAALYRLMSLFLHRGKAADLYAILQIGHTCLPALFDSGNALYYAGLPVVLVERGALKETPGKPLLIPYRAVETEGALIGFRPNNVYLHRGDTVTPVRCIVALCDRPFHGGVRALLHPDLIKERI